VKHMKTTQTNNRTNSMLRKNRTDMKNDIGMENVELK